MDNGAMLKAATTTVSEAIQLDNDKEYEAAYYKYQRALEQFLVALKYEKNPRSKEVLTTRIEGYMNRAEQLKTAIKEGKDQPKAAAVGGGGSEDAERSKLRGALASAIVSEKPNVKWNDVAGLEGAKEALKEAVILPVKFPQLFTGERRPWKGILLYGPPGTGKSYLAKAVATEADSMFYSVSSSDLVSKWQGESERLVRNLFEMARENKPAIIFIDEVDSLCGSRDEGGGGDSARRIKTEFLVQMQGVGKDDTGLLVLGATNTPWSLDPAMRRRFEKRIYIPLPDEKARLRLFELSIGDTPNNLERRDFKKLAKESEGFSGADISICVREALMQPLRICQTAKQFKQDKKGMWNPCRDYPNCASCPVNKSKDPSKGKQCSKCGAINKTLYDIEPELLKVPEVSVEDFFTALDHSSTSVSPDELTRFVEWTAEFGQEG